MEVQFPHDFPFYLLVAYRMHKSVDQNLVLEQIRLLIELNMECHVTLVVCV